MSRISSARRERLTSLRDYLVALKKDRQGRLGNSAKGLSSYIDVIDGLLESHGREADA